MTAAITCTCSLCDYEDDFKNARTWSTNCEEGFCADCQKVHSLTNMSRNHKLISIEDYLK